MCRFLGLHTLRQCCSRVAERKPYIPGTETVPVAGLLGVGALFSSAGAGEESAFDPSEPLELAGGSELTLEVDGDLVTSLVV